MQRSKLHNLLPFIKESQPKAFMYNSCRAREAEREKKIKVRRLCVLTLAAISIIEFQTIGGNIGTRQRKTSESVLMARGWHTSPISACTDEVH